MSEREDRARAVLNAEEVSVISAMLALANEELEKAAGVADALQNTQTLKLHAGEMTAQEVRTAKAVAGYIAAAIRKMMEE